VQTVIQREPVTFLQFYEFEYLFYTKSDPRKSYPLYGFIIDKEKAGDANYETNEAKPAELQSEEEQSS
jgi:hypothetical protein